MFTVAEPICFHPVVLLLPFSTALLLFYKLKFYGVNLLLHSLTLYCDPREML